MNGCLGSDWHPALGVSNSKPVWRYSKLHTCPGPKRQVLDVKNKGTHASHITDDSFVQWSWETQQWTAYCGTRQPHSTTSGSGQVLAKAFAWCHLQPNWYIRSDDRGWHQCLNLGYLEAQQHGCRRRPHALVCLLRRLLWVGGGHQKTQNMQQETWLSRVFFGDGILPSYMWIIINHYHDPYLTTRIQWKVRVYFFVAHLTEPSFWLPSYFQGPQYKDPY